MSAAGRLRSAFGRFGEAAQGRWFDWSRRVSTHGDLYPRELGVAAGDLRDSEHYVPARPANIRAILRDTGIRDFSLYTFVDLGSGKGRALFVAADYGFAECVGVEFSLRLHERAAANLQRFDTRTRAHSPIRLIHGNVRDVAFPPGNLVLYLFNPFGAETMASVLDRLQESLTTYPRHVAMVLLWPRCGEQVAGSPGARLLRKTRRAQIYEWNGPNAIA